MAYRFTSSPHDNVSATYGFKQYNASEIPFWRDGDRIRRYDPFTYAQRVQTPVQIVAADLDPCCGLEGAEQYFNALVAMRKPAEMVRYWGAGHGWKTLSYKQDTWRRTVAWFDDWGDILRDAQGSMVYENGRVKSRNGAPPLKPDAYAKFPFFGPGGDAASKLTARAASRP